MYFVGRQREIARIRNDLEQGDNMIVCGRYGIGRTSLLKHIATLTHDRWRFVFVDFSQSSSAVCQDLLAQLFPKLREKRKGAYLPYKSARFQLVYRELDDKRQHVLVLDNIAKLSAQKLNLLQYLLREKRFRFVAIPESFLPAEQFRRLRVRLSPAAVVTLDHLSLSSARQFFAYYSERYGFGWTQGEINSKATTTGGYPLGMREAVIREIERRRGAEQPALSQKLARVSHIFPHATTER
ncbi:MAG TPA: ATP-binding protein [Candidatus Binatia bacterium]|jgi:hypothetical protein|nr:ATP-binding protein [Candidatus Binatia bacterium]